MDDYSIEVPFGPSRRYRTLLWQYLALVVLLVILPSIVPFALFAPLVAKVIVLLIAAAIVIPVLYWIPRYYASISYTVGEEDITWKRGVWFKTTGIVPYQKVTNIDIGQGPLSRRLGIGSLKVQTAGYSASKQGAEISINGIEGVERLRDVVMPFVRASRVGATPVRHDPAGEAPASSLLEEVRAIRRLLEEKG